MATTKKPTVVGLPQKSKFPIAADPLDINVRLYRQVAKLLDQLEQGEHVTLKERFQALMAIARIQYVFVGIRKEKFSDDTAAGSTIRRYASAFQKDAARRGTPVARTAASRPEPEFDAGFGEDEDGDDGDAA